MGLKIMHAVPVTPADVIAIMDELKSAQRFQLNCAKCCAPDRIAHHTARAEAMSKAIAIMERYPLAEDDDG